MRQHHGARGIGRARPICARPRPRTHKQKPAWKRRVCIPARPGNSVLADRASPKSPHFRKPRFLPRAKCARGEPLPGGLRCNPGGSFAVIRPRHPRPVPHRPPASALDAAEPRGVRRPHRPVLPLRPHARCGHRTAQEHGVPPSGATGRRRASSRASGALVASMATSSRAASCRRRAGCRGRSKFRPLRRRKMQASSTDGSKGRMVLNACLV